MVVCFSISLHHFLLSWIAFGMATYMAGSMMAVG